MTCRNYQCKKVNRPRGLCWSWLLTRRGWRSVQKRARRLGVRCKPGRKVVVEGEEN